MTACMQTDPVRLQAVEDRWGQGFSNAWYIAGKVAPAMRHVAAIASDEPEVKEKIRHLLSKCFAAIEEHNLRHQYGRDQLK